MKEVKKPKILLQVEKGFLEQLDEHWKQQNFNTRTQYIMYLIRNDINESGKAAQG